MRFKDHFAKLGTAIAILFSTDMLALAQPVALDPRARNHKTIRSESPEDIVAVPVSFPKSQWIWSKDAKIQMGKGKTSDESIVWEKSFDLDIEPEYADFAIQVDDKCTVLVNGIPITILEKARYDKPSFAKIENLKRGENNIKVTAKDEGGDRGLNCRIRVQAEGRIIHYLVTEPDAKWQKSKQDEVDWNTNEDKDIVLMRKTALELLLRLERLEEMRWKKEAVIANTLAYLGDLAKKKPTLNLDPHLVVGRKLKPQVVQWLDRYLDDEDFSIAQVARVYRFEFLSNSLKSDGSKELRDSLTHFPHSDEDFELRLLTTVDTFIESNQKELGKLEENVKAINKTRKEAEEKVNSIDEAIRIQYEIRSVKISTIGFSEASDKPLLRLVQQLVEDRAVAYKELEKATVDANKARDKRDNYFSKSSERIDIVYEFLNSRTIPCSSNLLTSAFKNVRYQAWTAKMSYADASILAKATQDLNTPPSSVLPKEGPSGARTSAADLITTRLDNGSSDRPGVSNTAPSSPVVDIRIRHDYPEGETGYQRGPQSKKMIDLLSPKKVKGASGAIAIPKK